MTPDLIARLLRESLPVRLALLDAEPNGAGYLVPVGCTSPGSCYVAMSVTPYERGRVHDGAAWLPCNPLAIVEHAARLRRHECWPDVALLDAGWRMELRTIIDGSDIQAIARSQGKCPHTAAIALLREVVGG